MGVKRRRRRRRVDMYFDIMYAYAILCVWFGVGSVGQIWSARRLQVLSRAPRRCLAVVKNTR